MLNVDEVESILAPILERSGYTLYDLELLSSGSDYIVRIFIDKPDSVSIDDCVSVNDMIDPVLESEYPDEISRLEVSSAGITRRLKKSRHYIKSVGKVIFVTFKNFPYHRVEGLFRILSADDSFVTLSELETGKVEMLDYSNIASAQLEIGDF